MTDSFFGRVRSLLLAPSTALARYQEEGLSNGFIYYMKLSFITMALLIAVYFAFGFALHPTGVFFVLIVISFGFAYFIGLISIFFESFFWHIGVYLLGGRGGYERTAMAVMYSNTPGIFGIVPFAILFMSSSAFLTMDYTGTGLPPGTSIPGLVVAGILFVVLFIWMMVIRVRGFAIYHGFSNARAVLALVVPVVLLLLFYVVLFGSFLLGLGAISGA
jgi:hypothetical protein